MHIIMQPAWVQNKIFLNVLLLYSYIVSAQGNACSAGKYLHENECKFCSAGQYNALPGQTQCSHCDYGAYSATEGSLQCTKCPAGEYSNTTACYDAFNATAQCEGEIASTCWIEECRDGPEDCKPCAENEYCASRGCPKCTQCPAGSAPFPDKTRCIECVEGKYSSLETNGLCQECDKNTICPSGNCSACDACALTEKDEKGERLKCVDCDEEPGWFVQKNTDLLDIDEPVWHVFTNGYKEKKTLENNIEFDTSLKFLRFEALDLNSETGLTIVTKIKFTQYSAGGMQIAEFEHLYKKLYIYTLNPANSGSHTWKWSVQYSYPNQASHYLCVIDILSALNLNTDYFIIVKLQTAYNAQYLELHLYDATYSPIQYQRTKCSQNMPKFADNFNDGSFFLGSSWSSDYYRLYGFVYNFVIENTYLDASYDEILMRGDSYCASCVNGKYMDMVAEQRTGQREESCTACPNGKYSNIDGATSCELCPPCPDQHYRVGCTKTGEFGSCKQCASCESGKKRVDCINRAGHNDASGECVREEWVSSTPMCREEINGRLGNIGLGGFEFVSIFGADENHTGFQCSQTCDGTARFDPSDFGVQGKYLLAPDSTLHVSEMSSIIDPNYEGWMDTLYCSGPHACKTVSCTATMSSSESFDELFRTAWGCPMIIDREIDSNAVIEEKFKQACVRCDTCGQTSSHPPPDDFGRGCAVECTYVSECEIGEIFDWTEENPLLKCKPCGDLRNVRLCSNKHYVDSNLASTDVSGNRPKLEFEDCVGRSQPNSGSTPTYGNCKIKADKECKKDSFYDDGTDDGCVACVSHGDMNLKTRKYVSLKGGWSATGFEERELFCQIERCVQREEPGTYTGVQDDGILCQRFCEKKECGEDIDVACALPHLSNRCVTGISKNNGGRVGVNRYTPAHTNLLEEENNDYHYASFENLLINLEATGEDLHQCVWNVIDIRDNDMNPGGIGHSFYRPRAEYGYLETRGSKFCNTWDRDVTTKYPLLPLQNAVSFDARRHVYVNTSARVMKYWSESDGSGYNGQGFSSVLDSEKVDDIEKIERPFKNFGQASTDLDLFLNLDMRNAPMTTMSLLLPVDRNLQSVAWVPQWSLSAYVRESSKLNTGDYLPLSVRFSFDLEKNEASDILQDTFLQMSLDESLVELMNVTLKNFAPGPSEAMKLGYQQMFSRPTRFTVNSPLGVVVYLVQTKVDSFDDLGDRPYLMYLSSRSPYSTQGDIIESINIYDNETRTVTDIQTRTHDQGGNVLTVFSTLYGSRVLYADGRVESLHSVDDISSNSILSIAFVDSSRVMIAQVHKETRDREIFVKNLETKERELNYDCEIGGNLLRLTSSALRPNFIWALIMQGQEQNKLVVKKMMLSSIDNSVNVTSNASFNFLSSITLPVTEYQDNFQFSELDLSFVSLLSVHVNSSTNKEKLLSVVPVTKLGDNGNDEHYLIVRMWAENEEFKLNQLMTDSVFSFLSDVKSFMSHAWMGETEDHVSLIIGYRGHVYYLMFAKQDKSVQIEALETTWLKNKHFNAIGNAFLVFDLPPFTQSSIPKTSCGSGFYSRTVYVHGILKIEKRIETMCSQACLGVKDCVGFYYNGSCVLLARTNIYSDPFQMVLNGTSSNVCERIENNVQVYNEKATNDVRVPQYISVSIQGVLKNTVKLDNASSGVGYYAFCVINRKFENHGSDCNVSNYVTYETLPTVLKDGVEMAFETPVDAWLWERRKDGELDHIQLFDKALNATGSDVDLESISLNVDVDSMQDNQTLIINASASAVICVHTDHDMAKPDFKNDIFLLQKNPCQFIGEEMIYKENFYFRKEMWPFEDFINPEGDYYFEYENDESVKDFFLSAIPTSSDEYTIWSAAAAYNPRLTWRSVQNKWQFWMSDVDGPTATQYLLVAENNGPNIQRGWSSVDLPSIDSTKAQMDFVFKERSHGENMVLEYTALPKLFEANFDNDCGNTCSYSCMQPYAMQTSEKLKLAPCASLNIPPQTQILSIQNMQKSIKTGLALNLLRTWVNRTSDYNYWRREEVPKSEWLYLQRFLPGNLPMEVLKKGNGKEMPIYLNIERTRMDLDLTSEFSSLKKHRSVAVDDWQLLPVITEELTWFEDIEHDGKTVNAMHTYMYVPSGDELLEIGQDELLVDLNSESWQRLHVAVQLRGNLDQVGCTYRILVRKVNDEDEFEAVYYERLDQIGCEITFEKLGMGLCHFAVPTNLKNSRGVIGLSAYSAYSEENDDKCGVPDKLSFQALLTPYMQLYECDGDHFWSETEQKCQACEEILGTNCALGKYMKGCSALQKFEEGVCEDCFEENSHHYETQVRGKPENYAVFVPGGCSWKCEDDYFLNTTFTINETINLCQPCTTAKIETCRLSTGQKWQKCSQTENEKCVECDASELRLHEKFRGSKFKDCDRTCEDDYYRSFPDLFCRKCLTDEDEIERIYSSSELDFHRYFECSEFTNARIQPCQDVDCFGFPGGTARLDNCGKCDGPGIVWPKCNCNGDEFNECGVCGGLKQNVTANECACFDGSFIGPPKGECDCFGSKLDVCGKCNGTGYPLGFCGCYGNKTDACEICDGDNSTCLDCADVPGGGAVRDLCGVCGGDNSTCKDCFGDINGTAVRDACNVCNGTNSTCKDCFGKINGTAVEDVCGVCNGTNTSCLVRNCSCINNETAMHDLLNHASANNYTIFEDKMEILDSEGDYIELSFNNYSGFFENLLIEMFENETETSFEDWMLVWDCYTCQDARLDHLHDDNHTTSRRLLGHDIDFFFRYKAIYRQADVFAEEGVNENGLSEEQLQIKQKLKSKFVFNDTDVYGQIVRRFKMPVDDKTIFKQFVREKPEEECGFYRDKGKKMKFRSKYVDCQDCDGAENGLTFFDACGVCGGNNTVFSNKTSCLDCDGVPVGGKQKDVCNVCGGSGLSSCGECSICAPDDHLCDQCQSNLTYANKDECLPELDCFFIPKSAGGNATVDDCGICGGNNETCCSCDPGMYTDSCDLGTERTCQNCPQGTFKLNEERYVESCLPCAACEPGYSRTFCGLSSDGNCTACAEGKYKLENDSSLCFDCADIMCDKGFYLVGCQGSTNGTCEECPTNTYKNVTGAEECSHCQPCGMGNILSSCGHDSAGTCQLCQPGSYQNESHQLIFECLQCPAGFYVSESGAGECSECPRGFWSTSGASECVECPANSYTSLTRSTAITQCSCDKGYTGENGEVCQACEPGKFKDVIGNSTCSDCAAGKFSNETAAEDVVVCQITPVGTYSGQASSEPSQCPQFSHSAIGSQSIEECKCNLGYTGSDGGPCTACPMGKYKNSEGDSECSNCSAGKYSNVSAAPDVSVCEQCESGSYAASGSSVCIQCPEFTVTVNDQFSQEDCVCKMGYTINNERQQLVTGSICIGGDCQSYEYYEEGPACNACSKGTFKLDDGNSDCEMCVKGKYSNIWARTEECEICPSHFTSPEGSFFSTQCACDTGYTLKSETCEPCDDEYYKDFEGNGTCLSCVTIATCNAGKEKKSCGGASPGSCQDCLTGKFKAEAGPEDCTTCGDCPAGQQRNSCGHVNAGSCASCLDGTYKTTSGSEGCSSCTAFDCNSGEFKHSCGGAKAGECSACNNCPDGMKRLNCVGFNPGNCEDCEAGKFDSDLLTMGDHYQSTCKDCFLGKYQNSPGQTSCLECTNCGPGKYILSTNACKETQNRVCTLVPAGNYQDENNQYFYKQCPASSDAPEGSSSLQNCLCNAGFSGPNGGPCTQCGSGKYKSSAGTDACTDCGIGKYSGTVAATSDTACVACPTSSDAPAGSSSCICNAGFSGSDGGSCTQCVSGKYKDSPGPDACTDCGVGKYSDAAATSGTTCVACPESSDAPAGSSNCLCNAGFSGPDGGSCTKCVSGKYKASAGPNACTDCEAGKYSVDVAATSGTTCVACDVGKFSSTTGAGDDSTCTQCTGATFSNLIGASMCTACHEHSTSTGTGTGCHCNTGYSLTTDCTACPIASYKNFIGNHACTKCPDNHITENPGSPSISSCKLCNSIKPNSERNGVNECVCAVNYEISDQSCTLCGDGKHKTERGDHTCVLCPLGKYGDSPTCKSCEQGKYQNQRGQTDCIQIPSNSVTVDTNGVKVNSATDFKCNGGYYKNTIQDTCDACPAGKFSNTDISSSTSCTNCAIGKFAQTAAATICTACVDGKFAKDTGSNECLDCSESCSSSSQYISESCTENSDIKCADCSCSDSSISNGHGWNYYDSAIQSTCQLDGNKDVICSECPEDHWSDNGECKQCTLSNSVRGSGNTCSCKPGYRYEISYEFSYISGVVQNCVPCEAGKYLHYSSKNPVCDKCPDNQYSDAQATTCSSCETGKFSKAGESVCTQCENGKFYARENPRPGMKYYVYLSTTETIAITFPTCMSCNQVYSDVTIGYPQVIKQHSTTYNAIIEGENACECNAGYGLTHNGLQYTGLCNLCSGSRYKTHIGNTGCDYCGGATNEDRTACCTATKFEYNGQYIEEKYKDRYKWRADFDSSNLKSRLLDKCEAIACNPGYGYFHNGDCLPCLPTLNQMKLVKDGTSCENKCNPGQYADWKLPTQPCSACPAGQYFRYYNVDVDLYGTCSICPFGKYTTAHKPSIASRSQETSACHYCQGDIEYAQDGFVMMGGIACRACRPGTYSTNAYSECLSCPVGKYNDITGAQGEESEVCISCDCSAERQQAIQILDYFWGFAGFEISAKSDYTCNVGSVTSYCQMCWCGYDLLNPFNAVIGASVCDFPLFGKYKQCFDLPSASEISPNFLKLGIDASMKLISAEFELDL